MAAIAGLLAGHRDGHLFVAGCKTNQGKFYAQFDHVVLLSAPADVLLARIMARDNNPYGKRPAERALILRYLDEVEPRLRTVLPPGHYAFAALASERSQTLEVAGDTARALDSANLSCAACSFGACSSRVVRLP